MELYKVMLCLIKDEDFLSHIYCSQYWRHSLICLTKFVPCLKNSYPITWHWSCGGRSGCTALPMCNLGAGWECLVSAMPWVLYPWKKSPGTALYRLCGCWGQKFCFTCDDSAAPQDKLVARKLLPVLSTACTLKWVTEFVHSWVCGCRGTV